MIYAVLIKPSALKEISRLPDEIRNRAIQIIGNLKSKPRPTGCIKLRSQENRWRIRISNYRILYEVEDESMTVRVFRVTHRKEVYKER
ncbi:MAG: type II toxin-antitoxin system RelE/ParE family toxin [Ignavibacteriae bacterium]|nr:type II toxin-antitoxin system RelE/ParE family toxin [Ignavibacteriota bacterium]